MLRCNTNDSEWTQFKKLEIGKLYEVKEEFTIKMGKESVDMITIDCWQFRKDMFSNTKDGEIVSPPSITQPADLDDLPF